MGARHQEEVGYVPSQVFAEAKVRVQALSFSSASLLLVLDRPPPRQIQSALQHQSVYVVPSLWRSHLRGTARWRDGCVHVAMPGGGRCPRPRRPGRFGHRQPRQATTPAPRASERQKRRPLCCCLAHLPLGLPRIHDFKPSSEGALVAARAHASTRGRHSGTPPS